MADNLGITLAPPVSPQDIHTGGGQILAPADASSVGSPASSSGNDSSTNSDVKIQGQNSGSDSSWLLIVGAAIVLALIFIPGKKKR